MPLPPGQYSTDVCRLDKTVYPVMVNVLSNNISHKMKFYNILNKSIMCLSLNLTCMNFHSNKYCSLMFLFGKHYAHYLQSQTIHKMFSF